MPSKLLLHPNERLDKVDLDYAASGYSEAMAKLDKKTLLLSRRALVANGFRLEIADQTSSPGQITIHNGSYVDVTGKLVTNEQTLTSSQTITLLGANGTFYVELTFVDADDSLDDRGFWDATFDNGTGVLKGKEYLQEVNTRTSTVWSAVSPVATTGFAFTANEQSPKIPFAILKTDSLGQITASVNPGLIDGPFATTLEDDVVAGANSIRVFDATLLAAPGAHLIIGGSENKIISSIDRSSGIVQLTTTLSLNHARGSIVSNVGGTYFMHQRTGTTVEDTAGASTHPDKLRRMFSGNEGRGNALMSSAYTAGARDDLQLRSLKDQIDFLAAQIRELKLGGVTSTLPSNFSNARYYDFVGSVQGAKQATYTIGNGTDTYGDFNGTDHIPFQAAHDAAVARGLSEVVIYVKSGVYTFTSSVTTSIPTKIVCQSVGGSQTELFGNVILFAAGDNISFDGGYLFANSGLVNATVTGVEVSMLDCLCQLGASSYLLNTATIATVRLYKCNISTSGNTLLGTTINGTIDDCDISTANGSVVNISVGGTLAVNNVRFICGGNGTFFNLNSTGSLTNSNVSNSVFSFNGTNTTGSIVSGTGTLTSCTFSNNKVTYLSLANTCKVFALGHIVNCSWTNNIYLANLPVVGADGTGTAFIDSVYTQGFVFTGNTMYDTSGGSNTAGNFLYLHTGIVRRIRIANNSFYLCGSPVVLDNIVSSNDIEIVNNVFTQSLTMAVSITGTAIYHIVINNNIIDSTEGGGISVSAGGGRNIHIDGNTIQQAAGVGPVDASAISVDSAVYVSVSNNTMDATSTACTGASVERASIHATNITYLMWNGNHLFWNPVNSGTSGQAQLKWTDCDYGIGVGNTAFGFDGTGSNYLWNGTKVSAPNGVVVFLQNMIRGTATSPVQGISTGGASCGSTSIASGANTFFP